jgi:hypothetical protein
VSGDVLEEAPKRVNCAHDALNIRPKVSRIGFARSLAGNREGLTGVSTNNDVHLAAKSVCREGLNIRPDRCRIQETRFHLCDQVRDRE